MSRAHEAKTGQKFKPAKAHILKGEHPAKARELAAKHHPAWDRLKESAQNLHTRNMGQVLGPKLDKPARFLLPWTVDGGATGGTGQAIRIGHADRKSVVEGKSESVRLNMGGSNDIKKK